MATANELVKELGEETVVKVLTDFKTKLKSRKAKKIQHKKDLESFKAWKAAGSPKG